MPREKRKRNEEEREEQRDEERKRKRRRTASSPSSSSSSSSSRPFASLAGNAKTRRVVEASEPDVFSSVNPFLNQHPDVLYPLRTPHVDFGTLFGMGMSQTTLMYRADNRLVRKADPAKPQSGLTLADLLVKVDMDDEASGDEDSDDDYVPDDERERQLAGLNNKARRAMKRMKAQQGNAPGGAPREQEVKQFHAMFTIRNSDTATDTDPELRADLLERARKLARRSTYGPRPVVAPKTHTHSEQLLVASLGWQQALYDAIDDVYEHAPSVGGGSGEGPFNVSGVEPHQFSVILNRSSCSQCTTFLAAAIDQAWDVIADAFGLRNAAAARAKLGHLFLFELSYPGLYTGTSYPTKESDIATLRQAGWVPRIHHASTGKVSEAGLAAIHMHHPGETFGDLPTGTASVELSNRERSDATAARQRQRSQAQGSTRTRKSQAEDLQRARAIQGNPRQFVGQATRLIKQIASDLGHGEVNQTALEEAYNDALTALEGVTRSSKLEPLRELLTKLVKRLYKAAFDRS